MVKRQTRNRIKWKEEKVIRFGTVKKTKENWRDKVLER
jgi:hypothetical protein